MPDVFDPNPEPPSFAMREGQPGGSYGHPEPAASPVSRHAAEWGLASLLGGGIMLLSLPPLVVFDLLYWLHGREVVAAASSWAMEIVFLGLNVTSILVIGVSLASLAIGIRALLLAARHRQPAGLALAGTLISTVAVVTTIFMAIGTFLILHSFPARSP